VPQVNNAGISTNGPVEFTKPEKFRQVLEVCNGQHAPSTPVASMLHQRSARLSFLKPDLIPGGSSERQAPH
jgi:hypothetical protein